MPTLALDVVDQLFGGVGRLHSQLCIIAIMQREELSDSRNRQAAGNQGEQNEGQIWQRDLGCVITSEDVIQLRALSYGPGYSRVGCAVFRH
jgi:hypothetical protein